MEVDKIAINDNFSSETRKNAPTNSANEQDVSLFRKHVADEPKEDVSTDFSDNSEDSVQNFGNLFRKLKLSDEKEQPQNQQNEQDSQENSPHAFYLKNPKKEDGIQDKKLPQSSFKLNGDSTKVQKNNLSQPLSQHSTKESIDFTKNLVKAPKDNFDKEFNKDLVLNENLPNKTFSEDSKVNIPQLTESLPIAGVSSTTTESLGTTIDSKATETTKLQVGSTSIVQQIKEQIVDRILVSTASLNANQSVKVVFSPTVLAETEVNIQKLGQSLQVQFVSSDVKSITFIQSNQMDLQGYLQSNLKQFEDVQVSLKEMDNDLDQPKDGRSRNRNEYQSLEDDEDEQ